MTDTSKVTLKNSHDSNARNESESGGHRSKTKMGHRFFSCTPPLFGSKSTISCFGERFHDGHCSLVSFLFAVLPLTVSRDQQLVIVGARAPPSVSHGVGATGERPKIKQSGNNIDCIRENVWSHRA